MAWDVIHKECGKPAFRWIDSKLPGPGDMIGDVSKVAHINGARALAGDAFTCDSCGQRLSLSVFLLPAAGGVWVPVEPKATDWPAPEDALWLKRQRGSGDATD